MFFKKFHPPVFQGTLSKKKYFEGWYYKHVSDNSDAVISIIPGISLSPGDSHSFIQIIDGLTGFTKYCTYPLESFKASHRELKVSINDNHFTDKSMQLNIEEHDVKLQGALEYTNLTPYPSKFFAPGIMGWYSFVPFMECYHGVVSVDHDISGNLLWNKKNISFTRGRGYIEKDWGKSFPEAWIWLQCNSFNRENTSLMVSIAKIPWLGSYFMGFLGFLYIKNKYYLFSTYNNSKISTVHYKDNQIDIVLHNKNYTLTVSAKSDKTGILSAPVHGAMKRRIKESVDARVSFQLSDKNNSIIYEDNGLHGGLEVMEEILSYY